MATELKSSVMLTDVMLMINYYAGKVGVPRQLVIKRDASSIPDAVTKSGLMLPLGMYLLCICSFLCMLQSVDQM